MFYFWTVVLTCNIKCAYYAKSIIITQWVQLYLNNMRKATLGNNVLGHDVCKTTTFDHIFVN